MIKYFKKILCYLLFLTVIYSQGGEITLNLTIVNSGKYSLASFLDPNINLWQVDIINNYTGTESKDLRLEVQMLKDNVKVIWGVSKPIELNAGVPISSRTNMNFVGTDLSADGFDDDFQNEVQTSGVLPAGQYDLTIRAYILGSWESRTDNTYTLIDKEERKISNTISPEDEVSQGLLNLNIDEKIVLLSPTNMESIYDSNPWFRWESPSFGTPQNQDNESLSIEYRIIVSLFNPELHSSLEDALNDETNRYFDSGWDSNLNSWAIGAPEQISIQYPATEKELSCGYQYCWRVEARESIVGFQSYNGGIWGWPEPAKSDVIYSFYYGSPLSENQINSPSSYVNTVLPTFSFSNVLCADSYEIWVSNIDDPEVNNPIWKSDYFQNTNYQYPTSANGLTPGEKYFWKIRVNPDTNPGPWSNIFLFTINDMIFLSPGDQEIINTLLPVFNISSPSNIAGYQLLISDASDMEVNEYNMLYENLDYFPYDFPINNNAMLNPGEIYFWKIQTLDYNGVPTKLINENTKISTFSVKPIELTFPDNGSYNTSLTPLFSWSAPIGISGYIIEFANEYDSDFDNIILSANVNNSFFLSSNLSSSLPFENGTTYLWRVRTTNNNGEEGNSSEYFSFSTILDDSDLNTFATETTNYEQVDFEVSLSGAQGKDINISIINGMEGADTYLVQLSDDSNMENIIDGTYLDFNSPTHSFSGEYLEWAEDYYIQILAYSDNEIIGQPSNIKMVIMPFEPGSQDQVAFTIELINDMVSSLVINITNAVGNATNYILRLSENSDMSNFLFSELTNTTTQYTYENLEGVLSFGQTYYAQLIPVKEGEPYGVSSNINNIYIPNIIPPELSDIPFNFNHSIPQSASYLIEISTTEDFAVIFYNQIAEPNNITIQNDIFAPGTPYYWRARGLDDNGIMFGAYSNPQYFMSTGQTATIDEIDDSDYTVLLENPSSQSVITTKNPTFFWSNYDNAEKYEIIVSKNLELTDVVWNSQNIFSNSTVYPTSGSEELEYDILYYWSVRPINDNVALANFSNPFSFTISPNFIPEIISPKDIADAIMPYFSWTKIQNAVQYGLIISNDDGYSSIIYNNQNINDNIFQYPDDAPALSYDTEYFCKIVALSNDGSTLGDYSNSTSFITPDGLIKLEFIFGNE